jgi:hypothetical protein
MIGKKIKYKLGSGGTNPAQQSPAGNDGACDCSGFVAWCLEISRRVQGVPWYDALHNGEWVNTDAIYRDAMSPFGFFERYGGPWETAGWGSPMGSGSRLLGKPGDLIVYPGDRTVFPVHVGHVGIVSETRPIPMISSAGEVVKVIHCSAGNYHRTGDAVQETDPAVFLANPKTLTVHYAGIEDDPPPPPPSDLVQVTTS